MKRKWVVEFEVDDIWIQDGFDLDDERAVNMLAADLSFAQGSEISAKVIKAPKPEIIKKLQGY